MSISSASILTGATLAASGGTALPFTSLGNTLNENSVVYGGTGILDRKTGQFLTRLPVVNSNSPSGYSQARNIVNLRYPKTLASGETVYNTVKLTIACDVETTDAEKLEIRDDLAQILFDTDFQAFWDDLVVS